tara:strand:- start:1129 stop:1410 length:282 start_codon:yes stop_codon:yes gene_type:complete
LGHVVDILHKKVQRIYEQTGDVKQQGLPYGLFVFLVKGEGFILFRFVLNEPAVDDGQKDDDNDEWQQDRLHVAVKEDIFREIEKDAKRQKGPK